MLHLTLITLLFGIALAKADMGWDPDPKLNARPRNISLTDLQSEKDPIGSYYRGNMTLRFIPAFWGKDYETSECKDSRNETFELSYPANATIARTNGYGDLVNPFLLMLESSRQPLTPISLHSVDIRYYSPGRKLEPEAPLWNLSSTTMPDGYSFTGDSKHSESMSFSNLTTCLNSTDVLFSGYILSPGYHWADNVRDEYAMNLTKPTSINGTFNNEKVSLKLEGAFNLRSSFSETRSALLGNISIQYSGEIDDPYSDELVLGKDKPEWTPTVGFTEFPNENDGGKKRSFGWFGGGLAALGMVYLLL